MDQNMVVAAVVVPVVLVEMPMVVRSGWTWWSRNKFSIAGPTNDGTVGAPGPGPGRWFAGGGGGVIYWW